MNPNSNHELLFMGAGEMPLFGRGTCQDKSSSGYVCIMPVSVCVCSTSTWFVCICRVSHGEHKPERLKNAEVKKGGLCFVVLYCVCVCVYLASV